MVRVNVVHQLSPEVIPEPKPNRGRLPPGIPEFAADPQPLHVSIELDVPDCHRCVAVMNENHAIVSACKVLLIPVRHAVLHGLPRLDVKGTVAKSRLRAEPGAVAENCQG